MRASTSPPRRPRHTAPAAPAECDNRHPDVCDSLARARGEAGDVPGAVVAGSKACNAGSTPGCTTLSWYLLLSHRPLDGLLAAQRATRKTPGDTRAQEQLGHALVVTGDVERGVEAYGRAMHAPHGAISQARIRAHLDSLRPLYPEKIAEIGHA